MDRVARRAGTNKNAIYHAGPVARRSVSPPTASRPRRPRRCPTLRVCGLEAVPRCTWAVLESLASLKMEVDQFRPLITWLHLRSRKKRGARVTRGSTYQLRDAVREFVQIEWLSKERRYTERLVSPR
jgi:hypothetical protein